MVRDKADNDKNNFEQLVSAIKESKKGSTLGVIAKVLTEMLLWITLLMFIRDFFQDAKFPGAFMDSWRDFWGKKKGDVKSVDIMSGLTYLMAPKEEGELVNIKKAAQVTSDVFSKYLKEQIMDIIDNDKVT